MGSSSNSISESSVKLVELGTVADHAVSPALDVTVQHEQVLERLVGTQHPAHLYVSQGSGDGS